MASADNNNGTPASMKREGTMQRTVREAQQHSYGCTCDEHEGEHDHDAETGQVVPKPARQTTMEKTAAEGIQFLKDSRKDTLLEVQGLVPPRTGAGKNGGAKSADNGGDHEEVDNEEEDEDDEDTTEATGGEDDSNSSPPKPAKQGTMVTTAKEGEDLLTNYMGGKPDGRTRAQQKAHEAEPKDDEDDEEDEDEPDAKKPRRTNTMQETAQAAQSVIADPTSMGGTRSETAAVKKAGQEEPPTGRQRKH